MAEDDNKKRKYKLFNANDDRPSAVKPCAFFASGDGCRNGNSCKFSHSLEPIPPVPEPAKKQKADPPANMISKSISYGTNQAVAKPPPPPKLDSDSDDSSDDSSDDEAPPPAKTQAPKVAAVVKSDPKQKQQQQLTTAETLALEMAKLQQQLLLQQQQYQALAQQVKQDQTAPTIPNPATSKPKKQIAPKAAPAPTPVAPTVFKSPPVRAGVKNEKPQAPFQAMPSEEEEDTAFLFGAVNTVLRAETPNARPAATQKRSNTKETVAKTLSMPWKQAVATGLPTVASNPPGPGRERAHSINGPMEDSPFVDATSVIDMLSKSGSDHALNGPASLRKGKKNGAANGIKSGAEGVLSSLAKFKGQQLPWQHLVDRTQTHPRFPRDYTFETDNSWVQPNASTTSGFPNVIAIDCEMCQTADPVTSAKDHQALIRFTVISGSDSDEVLVDQLVKPALPITDCRTQIHGITEEQLQGVSYSLRHAQAALLRICTADTIIIGHSVHNDLKALHFNHHNVIDTAYLYVTENEPGAAPSLRDVSASILGNKISEIHDSVQDARAALHAAMYVLTRSPASDQPISVARLSGGLGSNAALQLLVHRIPDFCTEAEINHMVISYTRIVPVTVEKINRGNEAAVGAAGLAKDEPKGRTTILFSSSQHADLAFDSIIGPNRPDKQGKAQKRVYLKSSRGGGYICFRKN